MFNLPKHNKRDDRSGYFSNQEKEVLREIIHSEKANLQVFPLQDKDESERYQKILKDLDSKIV